MISAMNYKQWERKADAIIKLRTHMRYIGVFALDGDLIAHAGAVGVQQDIIADSGADGKETARVLNIQIRQLQAKAVVNHIKCSSVGMVKIDVAHLQFLCFNQGTVNMIGMSNFNVETNAKAIQQIDEACFRLSRHHYTRADSIEGHHLLNIAATLWKDVVIIGIGLPGNASCLSAVKEMTNPDILLIPDAHRDIRRSMDEIRNMDKGKDIVTELTENKTFQNKDNLNSSKQTRTSFGDTFIFSGNNKENMVTGLSENFSTMPGNQSEKRDTLVYKRPENIRRTKSVDGVIDTNNPEMFVTDNIDERVKSATIRSIEALRNIGPFTGSMTESDESSELLRTKSTEMLIRKNKKKPQQSRSKSIGSVDVTSSRLNRRPSRATMV